MRKLIKHVINFDVALKYFVDHLDDVNCLSRSVLKIVDLKKGKFFTLLPENANISGLYHFDNAILQQNPLTKYDDTSSAAYQIIPSIREELSSQLMKDFVCCDKYACLFDDIKRYASDDNSDWELYSRFGVYCENDVYYLLISPYITKDTIVKCMHASNAFWHSLCVVGDRSFLKLTTHQTFINDLENFCDSAKLIFIGAYDGEGYIFWKREE